MKQLIDKKGNNGIIIYLILSIVFVSGCKKLVEVDPPENRVIQENVYEDDLTAAAVLTGLYTNISAVGGTGFGLTGVSKLAGLSADELSLWTGSNTVHMAYYINELAARANSGLKAGHELWETCYPNIYICNSAIEGITAATTLTPSVKQQLLGEAKFMRAFFYFYLVNLYGEVPLATNTDPEVNRLLPKSSVSSVYQLIISDLKDAQKLLSASYLNGNLRPYTTGTPERVRPTKWAATALLSRAFLYSGDYENAEIEASAIINNTSLFNLSSLGNVFLKNNEEAIWQLQPVISGWNTEDAKIFNLEAIPEGFSTTKCVYLSPFLLEAFETGDGRRTSWVGTYVSGATSYYFPYKYKQAVFDPNITSPTNMTEYQMVLRLGEQYLIRGEARAQLNNVSGAQDDLNAIRIRAGLGSAEADDKDALLIAILKERQVELFSEWGHRWLDLKRTGNVNVVMEGVTVAKGGTWESKDLLYPIPFSDLQRNPNLTQNDGYDQ